MKRLIPVLAIMLVLIMTAWDDASSRRYPEIRIDEVDYDHPWGGEQNDPDQPITYSTTISGKNELTIIGIIKTWNYRFFFNGSTFLNIGSNRTITTTINTETSTDVDQSAGQGGLD
jgi:hypothetical protein